jgi:hypothetical protein
MNKDASELYLPELMQGRYVIVEYMWGVRPRDDETLERVKQGEALVGQPGARTEVLYFDSYSRIGIEVKKVREGGKEVFIPWSAVLALYGRDREELEQLRREEDALADQETQGTGTDNPHSPGPIR